MTPMALKSRTGGKMFPEFERISNNYKIDGNLRSLIFAQKDKDGTHQRIGPQFLSNKEMPTEVEAVILKMW